MHWNSFGKSLRTAVCSLWSQSAAVCEAVLNGRCAGNGPGGTNAVKRVLPCTVSMVQVEEKQSVRDSSDPPPAPAPASTKPSSSAILAQCLKLLKGGSDEHKFAGLVMVTKHVPALTAAREAAPGGDEARHGGGAGQLRQICNAVGPTFLHRLLRTAGDSEGGGGGGGPSGLSMYQQIAVGVLAAFFHDESLVSLLTGGL